MIGISAVLTVKEGANADFEAVAKELVDAVNANEPGCLLYQCYKVRESESEYLFLEQYENDEALAAHRGTAHMKEIGGRMGPFMAGRPKVIISDHIG